MARILHNNRVKFPKDFFSIVLYTNMAAMTSSENHLYMHSSKQFISYCGDLSSIVGVFQSQNVKTLCRNMHSNKQFISYLGDHSSIVEVF